MKWIAGVILLIVTIGLLSAAVFMFPWFSTKTKYDRVNIENNQSDYWNETLGGFERDWDESTYYLQSYELKTSRPWNWTKNGSSKSSSSGVMHYNSNSEAGGWQGSYRGMVEAGYPVPGFLAGGVEQLNVYNFTYYMMLFSIIMASIAIVFIILAGLEKINAIVAKLIVAVAIVLVIMAPLYFALALPPAIETDDKMIKKVDPAMEKNNRRPPEAGGIMGSANEKDDTSTSILSTTDFAPGLGWWLAIVAIFTTIITLAFVTGPAAHDLSLPDYSRLKYHEFDKPYDRDRYDMGSDRYYDDYDERGREDYYEPGYTPRRKAYDSRDIYADDYARDVPPRHDRTRRPPPQEQYDLGRPPPRPPRPPRRGRRPPTPPPRRRRRPPPPRY